MTLRIGITKLYISQYLAWLFPDVAQGENAENAAHNKETDAVHTDAIDDLPNEAADRVKH
jgi:hypothetical protein